MSTRSRRVESFPTSYSALLMCLGASNPTYQLLFGPYISTKTWENWNLAEESISETSWKFHVHVSIALQLS